MGVSGVKRTPTLQEYRQLEADGKITRPLTDDPIGVSTKARRQRDAANSAAVTSIPRPRPTPAKEPA